MLDYVVEFRDHKNDFFQRITSLPCNKREAERLAEEQRKAGPTYREVRVMPVDRCGALPTSVGFCGTPPCPCR